MVYVLFAVILKTWVTLLTVDCVAMPISVPTDRNIGIFRSKNAYGTLPGHMSRCFEAEVRSSPICVLLVAQKRMLNYIIQTLITGPWMLFRSAGNVIKENTHD